MSVTVDIAGTTVNRVFNVSYEQKDESSLGRASVVVANTQTNRTFSYGDEVIITRNGTTEFVGVLEEKPSVGTRNLRLDLKARDKRAALHYEEVHRPFYERDPGAVIREAVSKTAEPRDPQDVFVGDTTSNWSSTVETFQLAGITEQALYERGSDLLFLYWKEGASGDYSVTLDPIPSGIAGDRSLLWFETRYLFNNSGGNFSAEVELRDEGGTSYVWDIDIAEGSNFTTNRLPSEEASSDEAELSGSDKLQYRINIRGSLPEPRAAVLDYGRLRRYVLQTRNVDIDAPAATVQDANREITRRFDATILELVNALSVEEGASSFVDINDDLHFEPSGDSAASVSIDYSSTRVVDASFDRDSTDIVNKVLVQGRGDLEVTLKDPSSISFYGVSPRDKPITKNNVVNPDELRQIGEGVLNENAWDDSAFSFIIADSAYRGVTVGEEIDVTWGPQDIDGTFVVQSKRITEGGKVELSFTGSEA